MSIFDRGIRGNVQNPFNGAGDASTVTYSNQRVPQNWNGNVALALNYIFDALYPNYKGTVANKAALPTNAAVNDYYIVSDDGDGKSAGYVFSDIQGVTSWIKRYDVDYSAEGILAEAVTRTSYMYISKYGSTDRDASGQPITGKYAGQSIYGGDQTNQNLTIHANKADASGYIQVANSIIPTATQIGLGTLSDPFGSLIVSDAARISLLTLANETIESSNGVISINQSQLQLGQDLLANTVVKVGNSLNIANALISDDSGLINFDNSSLGAINHVDVDTISAASGATIASLTFSGDTISSLSSSISFSGNSVSQIGALGVNQLNVSEIVVGTANINQSALSAQADTFVLSTAGHFEMQSPMTMTQGLIVTGTTTLQNSLTVSGTIKSGSQATLSTNNTDALLAAQSGALKLQSTTQIQTNAPIVPAADNVNNLGATTQRFKTVYVSDGLSAGTNKISMATLESLRNINVNATAGMSLFFDGSTWNPSTPDSEIDHRTLSGLTTGDAGHTQFALLAGRAGGQTLIGGSAAGENLLLDSTSNATKGLVSTSSTFSPQTDQTLDLGTSLKQWRHIYSTGIHYGLRLESFAGSGNYPANSAQKVGRPIFDTVTNQVAIDTGTVWQKVGSQKWLSDISADGTALTYSVNVSSQISDARTGVWQLLDNTNGFEQVFAKLTKTASTVTVTTNVALPAGSYRLIGFN